MHWVSWGLFEFRILNHWISDLLTDISLIYLLVYSRAADSSLLLSSYKYTNLLTLLCLDLTDMINMLIYWYHNHKLNLLLSQFKCLWSINYVLISMSRPLALYPSCWPLMSIYPFVPSTLWILSQKTACPSGNHYPQLSKYPSFYVQTKLYFCICFIGIVVLHLYKLYCDVIDQYVQTLFTIHLCFGLLIDRIPDCTDDLLYIKEDPCPISLDRSSLFWKQLSFICCSISIN